jgi:hydrogenase nickel incorporation protein HypB
MSQTIEFGTPILAKNDELANRLRARYAEEGVYVVNLLSSPGAGKTTTILATLSRLSQRYRIGVIEGDIASDVDAVKVKEAGARAVQINTGGLCHLESAMIDRALDVLHPEELDLIIIENVGNLVCTVDFDLGETLRAMILSVPENDDKLLKYPGIFQSSQAVIVSKIDTMPVFDFDMDRFTKTMDQINPQARIFPLSSKTGQGVDAWCDFLAEGIERCKAAAGSGTPAASRGEAR